MIFPRIHSAELGYNRRDFKTRKLDDGSAMIIKYTGKDDSLVIPGEFDGMPVRSIGREAFRGCSRLTEVTIPDTVKDIGEYAFAYCPNLSKVDIPDSVEYIWSYAFAGCNNLQRIIIPKKAQVSENVFEMVDSVRITVYHGSEIEKHYYEKHSYNKYYHFIPPFLYGASDHEDDALKKQESYFLPIVTSGDYQYIVLDDDTVMIVKCVSTDKTITIPDTLDGKRVSGVGGFAFQSCSLLSSITISNDIEYIADEAFYECSSLTSVHIPGSIKRIGKRAFMNCPLRDVTISEGVSIIDDEAFDGCWCANIVIPRSVINIGEFAFNSPVTVHYDSYADEYCMKNRISHYYVTTYNCNTDYSISSWKGQFQITEYNGDAFLMTIPPFLHGQLISRIGNGAFWGCGSLCEVTIPGCIKEIGDYAFYRCLSLQKVTILEGVKKIGIGAFYGCKNLVSFSKPDSLEIINDWAFFGCDKLDERLWQIPSPDSDEEEKSEDSLFEDSFFDDGFDF